MRILHQALMKRELEKYLQEEAGIQKPKSSTQEDQNNLLDDRNQQDLEQADIAQFYSFESFTQMNKELKETQIEL